MRHFKWNPIQLLGKASELSCNTVSQDKTTIYCSNLDAFLKTLGMSSSTTLVVANGASLTNENSAMNETSIAGHKRVANIPTMSVSNRRISE